MSYPLKISKPKSLITTGKFCLPPPLAGTGLFSATAVTVTISALTQAAGLATATATAHGLITGQRINITGATHVEYNGMKKVTVVDANTFTYYVDSAVATPAGGSPVFAKYGENVTGVGTDFSSATVGSWIYVPAQNAVREVVQVIDATHLVIDSPFPSTVTSQPLLFVVPTLYKGVAVKNIGAATGIYKEVNLLITDLAETNFDEAGIGPVCGDATSTTFKINYQ